MELVYNSFEGGKREKYCLQLHDLAVLYCLGSSWKAIYGCRTLSLRESLSGRKETKVALWLLRSKPPNIASGFSKQHSFMWLI